MKDIIFFAGFLFCVPVGILLAVYSRWIQQAFFFVLVFGTTNSTGLFGLPMDINFFSREWYRGSTRGIEVSYLDLVTIILLGSTLIVRGREGRKAFFWPASLGWMLGLLAYACVHTIVIADPKLFALFEISKIIRGILIFVTVALYVRTQRELELLMWAICATVGYEALVCLRDRYLYHVHRVRGTLGHPNILSLFMLIVVPFMITTTLSNVRPLLRIASFLGFLAAAGCVILSVSRTGFAALILLTASCGLVAIGVKLTARNVGIVVLTGVVFLGVLARSWDTIESRLFVNSVEEEFGEDTTQGRGVYFRYLFLIMQNEPLGVGLNNWSYAVTNRYASKIGVIYHPYLGTDIEPSQETSGLSSTMGGSQAAPAHCVFVITMGELGWPGFIVFICMLGSWIFMSTAFVRKRSESLISRFGLASFFAIGAIVMQGLTEWIFRITPIYILSHVIVGALAAIYVHRKEA